MRTPPPDYTKITITEWIVVIFKMEIAAIIVSFFLSSLGILLIVLATFIASILGCGGLTMLGAAINGG